MTEYGVCCLLLLNYMVRNIIQQVKTFQINCAMKTQPSLSIGTTDLPRTFSICQASRMALLEGQPHLISATLPCSYCYHPQIQYEETETEKGQMT